jgi:hypothetical protein
MSGDVLHIVVLAIIFITIVSLLLAVFDLKEQ